LRSGASTELPSGIESAAGHQSAGVGNLHAEFTLFGVQKQIETTRTGASELPQHDVLRDSLHVVALAVGSCFHENVDGLLEGASHETSQVLSINSVTRDGHQVTLGAHDVAKERQVTVVDVGTVERDDTIHLLFHRLSDGFDPHDGKDLNDIVGVSTDGIDGLLRQDAHQRRAVSF